MCNDMRIEKLTTMTCETLSPHAKVGHLSAAGTSHVLSRDAVTSCEVSRLQAFNWSIALVACCDFKVFGIAARLFAERFPNFYFLRACLRSEGKLNSTAGTIA
jgi:hypothetical protein